MSNDYPRKVRDVLASQNKKTISIVLTNTGPSSDASGGNPVFDIGVDDFTEETKTLAHAQAIGTIQEGKNTYQPSSQYQQSSITDNNGNPAPISDQYDDNTFIGQNAIGSGGRSMFISLSDSDLLEINVIKGKTIPTDSNSRTYNELLAEVNVTNGTQANSELTRNIVIASRRLNSNDPDEIYIDPNNAVLENESNVGKLTIQPIKGRRVLIPSYGELANNDNNSSVTGYTIVPNQLKNFGSQIPLVASGEIVIPKDTNKAEDITLAQVGALVPGLARSGLAKVSVKDMQVASVLRRISDNKFDKDTRVSPLDNDDKLSYGNYNSWLIPYYDISNQIINLPMIAIQFFALGTIVFTTSKLIAFTLEQEYKRQYYSFVCLKGFLAFFGINIDDYLSQNTSLTDENFFIILSKVVGELSLQAVGSAAGGLYSGVWDEEDVAFYSVALRNYFRLIAEDITNVVDSTKQAVDNPNISSVIGAIGSVASILSGNLRKIIDTFGYIGQSAINVKTKKERLANVPINSIYQSMASNRLRSKMIIPQSMINALQLADTSLGPEERSSVTERFNNPYNNYNLSENNKIPIADVQALELELEADYMPFYFHDLRTNEIVSFNAFLSDMSDSFNVDWNSETPYGRVEPVHQYKGTTRDINIGFFVVSTNPADFDVMWAKVNKLLTLIYPQYTKGREITSTNQSKFIQPFSQIPAASPVFRFRLGDVWKSNYSRFNVMRLFGITDSRTDIKTTSAAAAEQPTAAPAPPPAPPPAPSGQPAAGAAPATPAEQTAAAQPATPAPTTTTSQAWRGGRTGPVKVVFIGDSHVAPGGRLVPAIKQALIQEMPSIFTDDRNTIWEIKGVTSSSTHNWMRNGDFRGGTTSQGQARSRWAANSTNWELFTRDADVVLISLGANDHGQEPSQGGYGSTGWRERLDKLKFNIRNRADGSPTIIIEIPRPLGDTVDTDENETSPNTNYTAIVEPGSRTGNQRHYDSGGQHLTTAGSAVYMQNDRARAAIIEEIRRHVQPARAVETAAQTTQEASPAAAAAAPAPAATPTTEAPAAAPGTSAATERTPFEELRTNIQEFFNNDNNPIMKTFEENGAGGGLAVICKSLNVDWNESTWSTDYGKYRLNARAPLWIKIQMNMTAIHDIVPGVGADGFMTAPVYSVGNIVNQFNEYEDGDKEHVNARRNRIDIKNQQEPVK